MVKKLIILSLAFSLVGVSACRKGAKDRSMLKGETQDFITEGWLDDNTFQVRAIGAPNPKARGFVRRRTQSEESALLAAQKRVVELMVGAQITGASGSDSGESTGIAITKEFEGHVKGGSILKKTFDQDDNCEIVYRIHAKGLKKMAETAVKK